MYGLSSHGTAGRCSQCGVAPRPARTHHCRTCGACVFRFDHHCYWMGVCIGARNLRWFLAFVLTQGLTYLYGVLFLSAALWTAYRYVPSPPDTPVETVLTAWSCNAAVHGREMRRCAASNQTIAVGLR